MYLKLSPIFNYTFRVSNNYLKIINLTRICRFNTLEREPKKLTEKDLTPIDAEDNDIKVGHIIHKSRLNRIFRPHDIDFYVRLINKAAKDGNLEKLISIFFHDMILVDRFRPNAFVVNLILKHLADLGGHSEAAFKIIKKSIDIQIQCTDVTYSLLFKNCWKEIANIEMFYLLSNNVIQLVSNEELEKIRLPVKKALKFVDEMKLKDIVMGKSAFNSLLLALNKAGMIKESSKLLDEFLSNGHKPTSYTLCAMLEGCLLDRKSGFGLALLIFNKLVHHYKCRLDEHAFNTVLKVARYCQFGDRDLVTRVINCSSSLRGGARGAGGLAHSFRSLTEASPDCLLPTPDLAANAASSSAVTHCCPPPEHRAAIQLLANQYGGLPEAAVEHFIKEKWSHSDNALNYLASPTNMLKRRFDNIFDIDWLQSPLSPADKLACLGGVLGFVQMIDKSHCKPNIYILTSLITCLPFTTDPSNSGPDIYLHAVTQVARHFRVMETSGFKNAALQRNIRLGGGIGGASNEAAAAAAAAAAAPVDVSQFDPFSWVSYSRKCKTSDDVERFFYLLKRNEISLNGTILLSLVRSVVTWDARSKVLDRMKKLQIDLDRSTVVFIEDLIDKFRQQLAAPGEQPDKNQINGKNVEAFQRFQRFYAQRLDKSNVEPVRTGEKKIIIDEIPKRLLTR